MTSQEAIALLLDQCKDDHSTEESPRGSNSGPRVNAMLRVTGLGPHYPWCAAAVATWGVEALGGAWPVPRSADCDALLGWARKTGCLKRTDAQPGDIFLVLKSSHDAIHTGVVIRALSNGQVETWEGNTNNDGSREGYRVCQRRRNTSNLVFVRWVEQFEESVAKDEGRLPETPAYPVWVSPHGLFPKVQMRGGRPCAPVRQLVAAILGISIEATGEIVVWDDKDRLPVVQGKPLRSAYMMDGDGGRASSWAPVREIGEALGCVVSAGLMVGVGGADSVQTVTIGPAIKGGNATTTERTEI